MYVCVINVCFFLKMKSIVEKNSFFNNENTMSSELDKSYLRNGTKSGPETLHEI